MDDAFCPYHSDFARTHFARGVAAGKAKAKAMARRQARGFAGAVLMVLEVRGLRVTASRREMVLGCTDLEQLEGWVRGAVTVKTTAELFAPLERPTKVRR